MAALWWAKLFRKVRDSSIQSVTFTFPRPEVYPLPSPHKAHWNALDSALCGEGMKGALKEVHVQIEEGPSYLRTAAIKDALPNLYKNGLLHF